MKRLFATTFILFALLATSNAQASLWNWSFDDVVGTLITSETGYGDGTYAVTSFTVTSPGATMLSLGEYGGNPDSSFDFLNGVLTGVDSDAGIWNYVDPTGLNTIECVTMAGGGFCQGRGSVLPSASGFLTISAPSAVPLPAAAWLFMSGLLGLVYKGRKVRQAVS